jgi:dTDP-4-dehydrorhamnose reductase
MLDNVRFLIIGASGFIGQEVLQLLRPKRAVGTFNSHSFPGGVHFDACTMRLSKLPIDLNGQFTHGLILISNPLIDDCARDPKRSWDMNVRAIIDIVSDLRSAGIVPVFASSDAVFDGRTGGYDEDAPLCPIVTYGRHKAVVEWYLRTLPRPWIIARMSKTVSTGAGGRSIIGGWMGDLRAGRTLRCARDQRFSPADVADVANALVVLAERGATGVFNLGGPHTLSRLELLEMLVRHIRVYTPLQTDITACSIHDFGFAERRPLDTSLNSCSAYATLGFAFRDMDSLCSEAAKLYVQKYGKSPVRGISR